MEIERDGGYYADVRTSRSDKTDLTAVLFFLWKAGCVVFYEIDRRANLVVSIFDSSIFAEAEVGVCCVK